MRSRVVASIALAALTAGCAGHSILPSSSGPAQSDAMRGPQTATLPLGVKSGVPEESLGSSHFVVALPLRNEAELDRMLAAISDPQSPEYHNFISREAFLEHFAPSAADRAAVASELQHAGFTVSVMDQAVAAGGTQTQIERFFGTTFERSSAGALSPRSALRIPSALSSRKVDIIGLSGDQTMQTFSHLIAAPAIQPDNFISDIGPYFTADLKEAYLMPSYQETIGKGATIAIVIDAAVKQSDLNLYFKNQRLPNPPKIIVKKVDGGGHSASGDGEGTLDVEQSAGIAPGAKIMVYDPK
ncbi:MAG TPA: protease pro-enzyme activation domain-containing protein, partial [Candidatus Acidoferrales bacterium]|nr:protease pro-enzyme activation domain-containing protein [Candidatus Acidoferrales bacterium]